MSERYKINTVMSIDDCALDQILYKRIINRSEMVENVISFQLATEALAYLKSADCEKIDVILLDINMPRMNGFEFLEQAFEDLGSDFAKYIVIMLTTSLNPADTLRAKEFGVVKLFLNKPLRKEDLESIAGLLP